MKMILLATVVLLLCSTNLEAQIIKGKITGYDGKPIEVSDVIHTRYYQHLKTGVVDKNGNYRIEVESKGEIELTFCGINHFPLIVSFNVLDANVPVELDVQLQAYQYVQEIEELFIIGGFNEYNFETAEKMKNLGNGKFKFTLKNFNSDTLKYQVIGLINKPVKRSIQGTQADFYLVDGGGDYYSVLVSKKRNFDIIYDIKQLIRVESEPVISFRDPVYEKQAELDKSLTKWELTLRRHFSQAIQLQKFDSIPEELIPIHKSFIELYDNEENEALKEVIAIRFIKFIDQMVYWKGSKTLDIRPALELIEKTDPRSPLIETIGYSLIRIPKYLRIEVWEYDYLNQVIDKHSDKELAANLLSNIISTAISKDEELGMKLYNKLLNEFPETAATESAKKQWDPDRAIQVGRKIPDFSFVSLDDPNTIISTESLKGKYYLIDIWATWCGPCIAEMGNLHKVFETFNSKGFELLSISIDPTQERVEKFREGRWKMPWLNVWSEGQFQGDAAKLFEVVGVPTFILVDTEGKIISIGAEIRGEGLHNKLSKLLD